MLRYWTLEVVNTVLTLAILLLPGCGQRAKPVDASAGGEGGIDASVAVDAKVDASVAVDAKVGINHLFLFTTNITNWTNGNIAGTGSARANADAMCVATQNADYPALPCTNIRAALSIDTSDEIRDMPSNYGVPTDRPVASPTRVLLGASWKDIMDGDIDQTLSNAGIAGKLIWTGPM